MHQTNFLLSYYLVKFHPRNRTVLRVLCPQLRVSVAYVEGEQHLSTCPMTPGSAAEIEEVGVV